MQNRAATRKHIMVRQKYFRGRGKRTFEVAKISCKINNNSKNFRVSKIAARRDLPP